MRYLPPLSISGISSPAELMQRRRGHSLRNKEAQGESQGGKETLEPAAVTRRQASGWHDLTSNFTVLLESCTKAVQRKPASLCPLLELLFCCLRGKKKKSKILYYPWQ